MIWFQFLVRCGRRYIRFLKFSNIDDQSPRNSEFSNWSGIAKTENRSLSIENSGLSRKMVPKDKSACEGNLVEMGFESRMLLVTDHAWPSSKTPMSKSTCLFRYKQHSTSSPAMGIGSKCQMVRVNDTTKTSKLNKVATKFHSPITKKLNTRKSMPETSCRSSMSRGYECPLRGAYPAEGYAKITF